MPDMPMPPMPMKWMGPSSRGSFIEMDLLGGAKPPRPLCAGIRRIGDSDKSASGANAASLWYRGKTRMFERGAIESGRRSAAKPGVDLGKVIVREIGLACAIGVKRRLRSLTALEFEIVGRQELREQARNFKPPELKIARLLAELLSADDLEFERREAAKAALDAYRAGEADFPDYY